MSARSGTVARIAALKLIGSVLDNGRNLSDSDEHSKISDRRDRGLALHLAYGVLRWLNALDWIAAQLLKKPLRRKDRDVHRLILIGLFQLWKDDDPHAAVNESAESARKIGKKWAVPLINAVLRQFQREREKLLNALQQDEAHLAHPDWLLNEFRQDWPDHWLSIVQANNEPGGLWLRLNARQDVEQTREALVAGGFRVDHHPEVPSAARVDPPAPVYRLPGFANGRVSVQDPAAQLAAGLLDVQDHHRVLDACAAPGGKTGHLLEQAPACHLRVLDRSEERLERVRENLDRLGLQEGEHLVLSAADAAEPQSWWDGVPFNRILLDAPCTATGVIRRHPEIKWLRTAEQVQTAIGQQKRLLRRLWPLLEAGGILLYATCSVLRAENHEQIREFVRQHSDAELLPVDCSWGHADTFGRQVLPGEMDMDGFFYARLRKTP